MSQSMHKNVVETLTDCVPWALVAEFCNLEEILAMRLVSSPMASCISNNLSPFACASILEQRAVKSELSFVSQTWKKPFQDYVTWLSNGSSLDTLLCIMRIVKCLPSEMAVAYSGKYGRHAIPLQWSDESRSLEAIPYPNHCRRKNCRTCRMRIPHDSNANAEVYQYINVRYKKHRFDLTKFYPKCMPNLPPNVCCPICRSNTERTLVLSMLSYQSAGVGSTALTFTPYNDDDFLEAEGEDEEEEEAEGEFAINDDDNDGSASDEEARRGGKRQRVDDIQDDKESTSVLFAYPPTFDDVALPHRNEQIRRKENAKFAIAIHCTSCHDFGVLVPAAPCSDEAFSCFHQVEPLNFDDNNRSTVGGVLVRNKCSNSGCSNATLCRSCCRRTKHRPYATDLNPEDPVRAKRWCKHCDPDGESGIYCHACAWNTSVCL